MVLKILGVFVVVMLILFNIVADPKVTHWLNIFWVGFWVIAFVLMFFVAPSNRSPKRIKKHDREG